MKVIGAGFVLLALSWGVEGWFVYRSGSLQLRMFRSSRAYETARAQALANGSLRVIAARPGEALQSLLAGLFVAAPFAALGMWQKKHDMSCLYIGDASLLFLEAYGVAGLMLLAGLIAYIDSVRFERRVHKTGFYPPLDIVSYQPVDAVPVNRFIRFKLRLGRYQALFFALLICALLVELLIMVWGAGGVDALDHQVARQCRSIVRVW